MGLVNGLLDPAVMSSASSAVTYTSVYTDSEPGRYEDDETEDGPVDYPMDGGDDGDDDVDDSSGDDVDDKDRRGRKGGGGVHSSG
ncbi:hypothetical protein Tco_1103989 [Tanacetum coccineum]